MNQCAQLGTPKNTRLACTPGTNETNPFHSCHGFQVPIQTWTPSPHTWGPTLMRCLDLHLSPPPISRSEKSRSLWQESNKPSRSYKQVCARDNKSVTWQGLCNEQSLFDTDRETVQPSYAPWPRDTTCYTHHFIKFVIMILIIIYCE
jgi:hypothetical protein